MVDDKVEDFIDVDKFNEEVEKIKKEKVFEKPVKDYNIEAYRKVLDKLFEQIPASPILKEGVLKGIMGMFKETGMLEHISPEEFERMIGSIVKPDKKANNPDFLSGMFGGASPFDISGGGIPFDIKQPPPQIGKMLGQMLGGGPQNETLTLSGKIGDSQISIEITDEFTCDMAMSILGKAYSKFRAEKNANKSKN